ncbi:NnrU family protein [Celeribacter baekdonensis]|uniref:NnrU family protein n=1 Tax=Celeribacter baekdonensis B30 TaxID=1208323 RepID=K2JIF6_9RHOB|nr:NnrU family protein [Celeribacter baekdonensis]EKE74222.1 NnrU family protein [Celeribacter baekdonensis B30]
MNWVAYGTMFALFLFSHSIPTRPAVKRRAVAAVGARGFTILYSLLSLAMLLLLIRAANWPDQVLLWPQSAITLTVTRIGMLAVCMIFALSLGRPNPFSFGGAKTDAFDPSRPGFVRVHRHPLLLGFLLWAGLHLLPNGDLAHVLLFGALGGFAILGMRLLDRRRQKELGMQTWQTLWHPAKRAPLRTVFAKGDVRRSVYALTAYCALIAGHSFFAGVSVLW